MRKNQKLIIYICIIVLAIVIASIIGLRTKSNSKSTESSSQAKSAAPTTKPVFNKKQFSLTDPSSQWVVVNKQHKLQPTTYVPSDLVTPDVPLKFPGSESMQIRKLIEPDFLAMFAAAKAAGVPMMLSSGYRSYSYQVGVYNSYVTTQGQAKADTFSARPGSSEHQTGMAFDVEPLDQQCDLDQCFADTPAGKWVAQHAYEYGFIMRYPSDKTAVTGYEFEPWHFRYVGKDLALELHNTHTETLEEFFGVSGGTTYAQ